jgi:hypothetical protein
MTLPAADHEGGADPGSAAGETVNLSLISHTNAGKTTLVRTLLGRDVGEVRDAAHVTEVASGYVMLQHGGDTMMLWDTPGFGDTARLLGRLKLSGNPVGWLLTQVWDRWRERPLWSSQQAVRNARDQADLVLYLVNASEDPADAGYAALELEILSWIGKPVVLLLNQMGPPRDDAAVEEERWRSHLSAHAVVRGALTLDAFARCWVQEGALLRTVAPLLPAPKQAACAGLAAPGRPGTWTASTLPWTSCGGARRGRRRPRDAGAAGLARQGRRGCCANCRRRIRPRPAAPCRRWPSGWTPASAPPPSG